MAKSNTVWGIDIGQCALKALECRPHEKDSDRMVVESFDYIEYPKILSQPEAEPEELVREALELFLSRNDLTGSTVAISVAGQSGLARFIKLPPVESKKIPDIVKYEARQQIPFSLEDVVWDYQQLTGGSEEDEFALEPEVGLFAMKRDQVARALQPLEAAGIEVDIIQLTPLAVYNYVCFDRLDDLKSRSYDPQDPPESTVVISLGTDTTDLVVTNGYRVWQRNIPIGGNHFTRALSKELKLTFIKAEHLKRNATQADDPKAVFQAMRPIFSDLLAEIQRSLGYFTSIEKTAKIGDAIALGNAMKLPGLQRYLTQNLEQEVKPIEQFDRLSAGSSSGSTPFKENILSFAVAYGLCIQGMKKGELRTNLLPEEIVRSRLVRAKKPWAVAGIAALMLGMTFNYFSHVSAWSETSTPEMTKAEKSADSAKRKSDGLKSTSSDIHSEFEMLKATGESLVSNVEGRMRWLELIKAVGSAVPIDPRPMEERKESAEDISTRNELHLVSMVAREYDDIGSEYFSSVRGNYEKAFSKSEKEGAEDAIGEEEFLDEESGDGDGPTGEGWVIQLTGYHYHNRDPNNEAGRFVNNTLIQNLLEGSVELPDGENDTLVQVSLADLGISHPWLVEGSNIEEEILDPDADRSNAGRPPSLEGRPGPSARAKPKEPIGLKLKRYDFVVQFCWRPILKSHRVENAALKRQEEAAQQAETASSEDDDNLR